MVHIVMLMTASFTSQEVVVVTTLTRVTSELTAATTSSLHYICACHIYTHSLSYSIFSLTSASSVTYTIPTVSSTPSSSKGHCVYAPMPCHIAC